MAHVPLGDVLEGSDRRVVTPRPPRIGPRTLRRDRWWLQPLASAVVLLGFVAYATFAAFQGKNYWAPPNYISPFYSPCIASSCGEHTNLTIVGDWWRWSPALLILVFPLGFRLTCYYYRKAYYRAFWFSPPACAVAEPHGRYTGETRFPLILQNVHRYFFWIAMAFNVILSIDAVIAFRDHSGNWGHMGLGTLILLVNATLLWLYSLSCHACRHTVGGRLRHFSKHPVRYWMWTQVSRLNTKHMQYAWLSLFWVLFTDLYIRLVASGAMTDPRFF